MTPDALPTPVKPWPKWALLLLYGTLLAFVLGVCAWVMWMVPYAG